MSSTTLAPGEQDPSGLRAWLAKVREPALLVALLGFVGTCAVYGGSIAIDATHTKDDVVKVSEHVARHESRIEDIDRAERRDAEGIAAISPELRSLEKLLQDAQQTDQRIIDSQRSLRDDVSRRLDTILSMMRDQPRR